MVPVLESALASVLELASASVLEFASASVLELASASVLELASVSVGSDGRWRYESPLECNAGMVRCHPATSRSP